MPSPAQKPSAWRLYFTRPLLVIGVLGFYSGLPLALSAATLVTWLADSHIDRTTIGLFAAVGTPYALKFLWAPLADGIRLPFLGRLGRRRSWLFATQLLLTLSVAAIAYANPTVNVRAIALMAFFVALFSATQDIVIDAYRVERLKPEEQGAGAAMSTFGYRIGMVASGAGALALADLRGWQTTYLVMAAITALSLLVTLLIREPQVTLPKAAKGSSLERLHYFLRHSVIAPFADLMTRPCWLTVIAFVILYKLGDAMIGNLYNPFFLAIGFTKTQIAEISKLYGLAATLIGSFLGGWLVLRWGMFRTLLWTGIAHTLLNLLFLRLMQLGPDVPFFIFSIAVINITGGATLAAFVAYLSALCRVNYTATQYALLSALAALGRTVLSTPSGWIVEHYGWQGFYIIASALAVPGLLLAVYLKKKAKLPDTSK